jgi:hypothetical protein
MRAICLTTSVTLMPGFCLIMLSLLFANYVRIAYKFSENNISRLRLPERQVLSRIQNEVVIVERERLFLRVKVPRFYRVVNHRRD